MVSPNRPFPSGTKERVEEAIKLAREGLQACELADRAGIDCQRQRDTLTTQLDQLRRIQATYFTGTANG